MGLYSFVLKLPVDGTPVPKRVVVLIIVTNCISFSAFVAVSIDRNNMHGVDHIELHITCSVYVLHQYALK